MTTWASATCLCGVFLCVCVCLHVRKNIYVQTNAFMCSETCTHVHGHVFSSALLPDFYLSTPPPSHARDPSRSWATSTRSTPAGAARQLRRINVDVRYGRLRVESKGKNQAIKQTLNEWRVEKMLGPNPIWWRLYMHAHIPWLYCVDGILWFRLCAGKRFFVDGISWLFIVCQ